MKTIKSGELKKILDNNEGCTLVDVRSPEKYHDEGYIPTAINVPLDKIESWAKQSILRDEKVVVYSGSLECPLSSQAVARLTDLGFRNIIDFEGGLSAWTVAGYSLENTTYTKAVGE